MTLQEIERIRRRANIDLELSIIMRLTGERDGNTGMLINASLARAQQLLKEEYKASDEGSDA